MYLYRAPKWSNSVRTISVASKPVELQIFFKTKKYFSMTRKAVAHVGRWCAVSEAECRVGNLSCVSRTKRQPIFQ